MEPVETTTTRAEPDVADADAIVIGAGPAGCAVAIGLAMRGWSVWLVDRRATGRGKTCGHCLSPRALPTIDRLGLRDVVDASVDGIHDRLRIELPGSSLTLRLKVPGLLVRRDRLDPGLAALAIRCGVRMRPRCAVAAIGAPDQRGHRHVRLLGPEGEIRARARLVVGADGLGSTVAVAAGLAEPARRRVDDGAIGVSFDVAADASGWSEAQRFPAGTVRMLVGDEGYLGLVHQSDGSLHAAALLRKSNSRGVAPRSRLAALLGRRVAPSALDDVALVGASPMPWRPRAVAAPGVALVGDAASYAEPFTGEGMAWAFESAGILLSVVGRSSDGARAFGSASAVAYGARWSTTVGAAQRRCRRVGVWLGRPRVLSLAARVAPRLSTLIGGAVVRRVMSATAASVEMA